MTPSLDDLFEEEEERRRAQARMEIAAEKAAWDALTPEQKAAQIAAIEVKFANVPDCDGDISDEDDEEA